MHGLVTVISPSYMSAGYIGRAIDSVLRQTYCDWELIVVDDCSPDNSNEVIDQYAAQDKRIRLVKLEANSGAAVARNTAIEMANGRFIAFLDADDQWLPHKLEKQVSFMLENDFAFSFTAYEKLSEVGSIIGKVAVPSKVSYQDMLKVSSIGCLTAMYDAAQIGKMYMPLIRKRQDLGLWLNILKKTQYAYGLNEVLARYQLRADSMSADKLDAAKFTWRLYREVEKINFPLAAYYFCHYAVNGFLRTKLPRLAKALGKI